MKKYILLFMTVLTVISATGAFAQLEPPKAEEKKALKKDIKNESGQMLIKLDYKEISIVELIKMMSDLTNKNFLYDERILEKNVTIVSPKYVTIEEAFKVLMTILDFKGFSIIETGDFIKIINKKDAKEGNIDTYTNTGDISSVDRFITQLIPLKYINAQNLQNVIKTLVSPEGLVFAFPDTNTLIIIDTAANIERVIKITNELDLPTPPMVYEVIQLKYASAQDIVRELATVFSGGAVPNMALSAGAKGAPSPSVRIPFKIIADTRTNAVIAFADEATLGEAKKVIEQLDIDIPEGFNRINVYYLKYANADEIAQVLTNFSQEAKRKNTNRAAQKNMPPPPVSGSAPTPTPTPTPDAPRAGSVQIEGDVTITADKATNALIILASPTDYEIIKSVIKKLDIMRPQVLVEAFIIEISLDREQELGIEWRSTSDFTKSGDNVMGGTNFGTINSVSSNPLATPSGLMIGSVRGTVNFGGKEFLNIGALMRALEVESGINIMSRPHILSMDNEEAEINVVDNIPYKISEKYDTNGNPIFSYDYKDVGVKLKLTPQVMESNYVKLNINQEISQVVKSTQGIEATAPTTSRRTAISTVFVKDDEMVVIGGLIKDNEIESVSKVPCLGDLPLLGVFFRANSVKTQKTDLLVFLTPHVIKEYGKLEELSTEKRGELNEFKDTKKFGEFQKFNLKDGDIPVEDGKVKEDANGKKDGNAPDSPQE